MTCPSHCVPLCSAQFPFVILLEMSTMISYLRLYLPDFSPIKLLIPFYNQYFVGGEGALRLYNILVLINLPAASFNISLCFLAELLLWWLLNDDILISSFLLHSSVDIPLQGKASYFFSILIFISVQVHVLFNYLGIIYKIKLFMDILMDYNLLLSFILMLKMSQCVSVLL